ncbi:MAG: hypothetical protein HY717_10990 [Planctomycetes bacterium]|nr:hypothetical protein [Planctomycetota bacterium]
MKTFQLILSLVVLSLVVSSLPVMGVDFVRGDADAVPVFGVGAGGEITITDAIFTLVYLFLGGPAPPCLDAADTNDDEELTIADPIMTLMYLFILGPAAPPPAPTPSGAAYPAGDCGPDPAGAVLDCALFPPCP